MKEKLTFFAYIIGIFKNNIKKNVKASTPPKTRNK